MGYPPVASKLAALLPKASAYLYKIFAEFWAYTLLKVNPSLFKELINYKMDQKGQNMPSQNPYYPQAYQQHPAYAPQMQAPHYPGVEYANENYYGYPPAYGNAQGLQQNLGPPTAVVIVERPNPPPQQVANSESIFVASRAVKIASIAVIVVRYATFFSLLCIAFPILGFVAAKNIKYNLAVFSLIGELFTGVFVVAVLIIFLGSCDRSQQA